jgi:hypothetical protein
LSWIGFEATGFKGELNFCVFFSAIGNSISESKFIILAARKFTAWLIWKPEDI